MYRNKKILVLLSFLLVLSSFLVGCGNKEKSEDIKTVKLGITSDESEVWDIIKDELKKEDINLEIVGFSDYTRPNIALAEGEIDINAFQHYAFFNKFKDEHNLDLEAIGETVIAPLGIYSKEIENVEDIKKGSVVAIPNDETNLGRSLVLLKTAGLLEVEDVEIPNLKDITSNPLNLEIKELDASIISRTLEDVDFGIINSGFAVQAGYNPVEDSIFLEPINDDSKPYINIIAARKEDKDDPILKRIVELYQTKEIEEIINKIYGGSQQIAW